MFHLAPPLTQDQYRALCARLNAFNAWVDTKRSRSGWASYRPDEVPAELKPEPTNEERGLVELQDLHATQPERLFCYVTRDSSGAWKCGNFPGQLLGLVHVGPSYRSPAFGGWSTRRAVRLSCVNGVIYSGTLYESSGDYARLRKTRRACSPEAMELMRRANFGPGNI